MYLLKKKPVAAGGPSPQPMRKSKNLKKITLFTD